VVKVPLALLAVIIDCHDPRRQAEWWAGALAYQRTFRGHMTAVSECDRVDVCCYRWLSGLAVL
jgi:hypothetical protein